jgi:hypothetical protein
MNQMKKECYRPSARDVGAAKLHVQAARLQAIARIVWIAVALVHISLGGNPELRQR